MNSFFQMQTLSLGREAARGFAVEGLLSQQPLRARFNDGEA